MDWRERRSRVMSTRQDRPVTETSSGADEPGEAPSLETYGYRLKGLGAVNVVLGKNGCGKSTLLKSIEQHLDGEDIGRKKYVPPERGGMLSFDGSIEANIANRDWMPSTRRVNQLQQFRQQSVAQLRRLELTFYRSKDGVEMAEFAPFFAQLNSLLDNVHIRKGDPTFTIHSEHEDIVLDPSLISSGESELISLGIEILMFSEELEVGKTNILFLDEPDVHLHPDLQGRLIRFLTSLVDEKDFVVLMATHSTAVLAGLADYEGATVALMKARDKELTFKVIGPVHERVLPVFGAHPLSNIFNERPVLIVEGQDDERVWQQAVRSAQGAIALYPVSCDGLPNMSDYEREVADIIEAVYDDPVAFSLRDGDGIAEDLDPMGAIVRLRLACRTAENLLLSDEVLTRLGLDWPSVTSRIDDWIDANESHEFYAHMTAFKGSGYERKLHPIKEIRMLLLGVILTTDKPWEVIVGQAIAAFARPPAAGPCSYPHGSLPDFLGRSVVERLLSEAV